MKYKISFEVNIPTLTSGEILTDDQVRRYFHSEINFRGLGKDNPLEYWSYENCTENLSIEKIE